MKGDNIPIELPDNPMPFLVEWLMEIGPIVSGGMGSGALSWSDLRDWEALTGNELDPWEARTIRRLSRDFLDQMHKSHDPACPAPYTGGLVNQNAVDEQFKQMFAAMRGKGKKAR